MRRMLVWGAVAASAVLLVAACGDDDDDDTSAGAGGTTASSAAATTAGDAAGSGDATAADATVAVAQTSLGDVLVDASGMTLYAFTPDTDGVPTCAGQSAENWPAALVEGDVVVADGLDAATFSLVPTLAGGQQLMAGTQPLYLFAGDSAPGDVNGQEVGDVWFAVHPDGTLYAPADAAASSATTAAGGYGY